MLYTVLLLIATGLVLGVIVWWLIPHGWEKD